jgi:hypothetical protein
MNKSTKGHRPLDARKLARIGATVARVNAARAAAIDYIVRACDAGDRAAQRDTNNVLADRHRLRDLGELLRADRLPGPEGADHSRATGRDLGPGMHVWRPPLIDLVDTSTVSQLIGIPSSTLCSWRRRGMGPAFVYVSWGNVRYHLRDLVLWIEAQARAADR